MIDHILVFSSSRSLERRKSSFKLKLYQSPKILPEEILCFPTYLRTSLIHMQCVQEYSILQLAKKNLQTKCDNLNNNLKNNLN